MIQVHQWSKVNFVVVFSVPLLWPPFCSWLFSHPMLELSQAVSIPCPLLPLVRVRSGFLCRCGGLGPSTAFPSWWAPVYCGCPAGTHGCDPVSRVRLDQSANPVVVWLGLVLRDVKSLWSHGAFVHLCLHLHTFASGIFIAWGIGIN